MRSTPLSRAVAAAVLILLCVAAGLAYVSAAARASHTGGMDAMSIDTDVTGNTATILGARENCIVVAPGARVSVDVTAENIPASNPMIAFGFDVNYPSTVMAVEGADPHFLIESSQGSSIFDATEPVPDTDGRFNVGVLDVATPAAAETGSGVLTRLTIAISSQASPGQYILTLSAAVHLDPLNEPRLPDVLNHAFIAVNASCEDLPTPTPTPAPTLTPTPGPSVPTVSISSGICAPASSCGPVNLTVTSTIPVGALDIDVNYDSTVLTATACTPSVPPPGICNPALDADTVRFSLVDLNGLSGVEGSITFNVVGADGSQSPLDVVILTCVDVFASNLNCADQDGTINVSSAPPPSPSPQPSPPPPCAPPPANDDISNDTAVGALPFTDQVNTLCATTAANDSDCFGRGPTVWYSFTAPADQRIEATTFGSNYDTTLSAYTGSPGALSQIACNDDSASTQSRVVFDATSGQTYFLMAGSFLGGAGGNLVFNVAIGPPPLAVDLTIDPRGEVVVRDGAATVHGTVTCTTPAEVEIFGELRQRAGRAEVFGFFDAFVECAGYGAWSAEVTAENGRWAGGRANVSLTAFGFTDTEFDEAQAEGRVQFRGTRPAQPAPTRCPRDGNPGFESGVVDSNDIACWTVSDIGTGSWCTQAGTVPPLGLCTGGLAVVPPSPEGIQAAMASQGGPGAHLLYRCGTLLGGSIGFQLYLNNQAGVFVSAPTLDPFAEPNQQFRADLVRASAIDADPFGVGATDVLMNLYQTAPGDPLESGYLQVTADASAYVGQSVCLRLLRWTTNPFST